eukprot:4885163-Pyramimonas_sp.AAC.1
MDTELGELAGWRISRREDSTGRRRRQRRRHRRPIGSAPRKCCAARRDRAQWRVQLAETNALSICIQRRRGAGGVRGTEISDGGGARNANCQNAMRGIAASL